MQTNLLLILNFKKMNLEKLNVVELSVQEVQETIGGGIIKEVGKAVKKAWGHFSDFCEGVWDGIVN